MNKLTVGSLFSGIGGFDTALESVGMEVRYQVEKDVFCNKILNKHWPNVTRYEDVSTFDSTKHKVDIIVGGFPCQDISIAGKRSGLAGSRSGLWFEFERVLRESRPTWAIIENVAGLVSSKQGRDLSLILDSLTSLGYICDIDILDTQHFGIPQRRRRVFIVCHQIEDILLKKTITSEKIIGQLLAEISVSVLVELNTLLNTDYVNSNFLKKVKRYGLRERIEFLGINTGGDWLRLLSSYEEMRIAHRLEQENSEYLLEKKQDIPVKTDTGSSDIQSMVNELHIGNILTLWKNTWEGISSVLNWSTTSTVTKETLSSIISGYAQIVLHISEHTVRLNRCSKHLSNEESSILTNLKVFIDYARQEHREIHPFLYRHSEWGDFLRRAERFEQYVGGGPSRSSVAKVLSLCESCGGDLEEGCEEKEKTSDTTRGSTTAHSLRSSTRGTDDPDRSTYIPVVGVDISPEIQERDYKGPGGVYNGHVQGIVAIQDAREVDKHQNGLGVQIGGPMYTLDSVSQHAVSAPVTSKWAKGSGGPAGDETQNLVVRYGVRRLTPIECARLQGFPDDWLCLCEKDTCKCPDLQQYKTLGNAVTTNVIAYLGRRILQEEVDAGRF